MSDTHKGTCACGAVVIEATGTPAEMGYCHCNACRAYSGGPINAFTLWKEDDVRVTQGEDVLGRYQSSEFSIRRYCTRCGGHVLVEHPSLGLLDLPAGILPSLAFNPAVHLNYEETVLPMKDGLPKFKDFPKPVGGSGELMPE